MMKVNEMVQIHEGYASVGGMFINEKFTTGTVVKVNAKSIRVHMTHVKCTTSGKVTREYNINEEAAFTFWKTIETADKTVSIFKNNKYGIIKVIH